MLWSWVDTECSMHRVQHTPEIVFLPFIITISSWPLNVASASSVPPSRSTTTSQFSISASKVKSRHQIPTVSRSLINEYSLSTWGACHRPPPDRTPPKVLLQSHSMKACKCIIKLARSQPPSSSPNFLDHGLQVHIQTRSIPASQCISKFTESPSPIASPISVDHVLHVHLWVHLILASMCISKLARSRPPSASLHSHDFGLQEYL